MNTKAGNKGIPILVSTGILMFSMLACEPVIAVGWREILFVFILVAIVFGPPIYRLLRKLEDFKRRDKSNHD